MQIFMFGNRKKEGISEQEIIVILCIYCNILCHAGTDRQVRQTKFSENITFWYIFLFSLKSDRVMIHMNLAFAIGLAQLVFLCLDIRSPTQVSASVWSISALHVFYITICNTIWQNVMIEINEEFKCKYINTWDIHINVKVGIYISFIVKSCMECHVGFLLSRQRLIRDDISTHRTYFTMCHGIHALLILFIHT